MIDNPLDALARLQLARALALAGDTVKAKSAYSDLLTLWKNADAGLPSSARKHEQSSRGFRNRRIPVWKSSRSRAWGEAPGD